MSTVILIRLVTVLLLPNPIYFYINVSDRVSGLCGWDIIYAKSNFEAVYKKVFRDLFKKSSRNRLKKFTIRCICKKLLNFQNTGFLYRKSYSKFDGFWGLSIHLVVFFRVDSWVHAVNFEVFYLCEFLMKIHFVFYKPL